MPTQSRRKERKKDWPVDTPEPLELFRVVREIGQQHTRTAAVTSVIIIAIVLLVFLLLLVLLQAIGALRVEPRQFTLLCVLLGGTGFGGVLWAISLRK